MGPCLVKHQYDDKCGKCIGLPQGQAVKFRLVFRWICCVVTEGRSISGENKVLPKILFCKYHLS